MDGVKKKKNKSPRNEPGENGEPTDDGYGYKCATHAYDARTNRRLSECVLIYVCVCERVAARP